MGPVNANSQFLILACSSQLRPNPRLRGGDSRNPPPVLPAAAGWGWRGNPVMPWEWSWSESELLIGVPVLPLHESQQDWFGSLAPRCETISTTVSCSDLRSHCNPPQLPPLQPCGLPPDPQKCWTHARLRPLYLLAPLPATPSPQVSVWPHRSPVSGLDFHVISSERCLLSILSKTSSPPHTSIFLPCIFLRSLCIFVVPFAYCLACHCNVSSVRRGIFFWSLLYPRA